MIDRQPLRTKPGCDNLDVVRAQSEAICELFRREPVVIVRRAGILLLGEERFETVRRFHQQSYLRDLSIRRHPALIELRLSARMNMALQNNASAGVHRNRNTIGCCVCSHCYENKQKYSVG